MILYKFYLSFAQDSGIFFIASLTFPMDPNKSPKFGVAAWATDAAVTSRELKLKPQKAIQALQLLATQRAKPKATTLVPRTIGSHDLLDQLVSFYSL